MLHTPRHFLARINSSCWICDDDAENHVLVQLRDTCHEHRRLEFSSLAAINAIKFTFYQDSVYHRMPLKRTHLLSLKAPHFPLCASFFLSLSSYALYMAALPRIQNVFAFLASKLLSAHAV
jgi:hypothetical protein